MPGQPQNDTYLELGPYQLRGRPLEEEDWLRALRGAPGPASLCLACLRLADAHLEDLQRDGQEPRLIGFEHLERLPAGTIDSLLERLRPRWLEPDEETELQALEEHLRFVADYPGLSCAACREQEAAGEGPPDCPACPLPPLPPSCQPALHLYPLLLRLPPGAAAALLPAALGHPPPGRARRLLLRLGLIHGLLGPGPGRWAGPSPGGVLD